MKEVSEVAAQDTATVCSRVGCQRPIQAIGLCVKHYRHERALRVGRIIAERLRPQRRTLSPEQQVEAFWALADRSGGPNACWPCVGLKPMWNGYCSTRHGSDKKRTCHRIAWELVNGEIDESVQRMTVMHDCPGGENRRCMNPAHMKLGTYSENTIDMFNKGRSLHDTLKPWRRLDDATVDEIRAAYAAGGVTQNQVADRFGVTAQTVSVIARGEMHSPDKPKQVGENHFKARLRIVDVENIRLFVANGATRAEMAAQYGVSKTTIDSVVLRRNWKRVG